MKIYRAVKTSFLTQKFGENRCFLPYCHTHKKFYPKETNCPICGTELKIENVYTTYGLKGHNGLDWLLHRNEPVHWEGSIRGEVIDCSEDRNGGLGVKVLTEENGELVVHRFWHFLSFACKEGDIVETGDFLGYGDNTGTSSGDHLHRDYKPMIRVNGRLQKKFPNNGYRGAINYEPLLVNIFVLDYMKNLKAQVSILQKIIECLKLLIKGRQNN